MFMTKGRGLGTERHSVRVSDFVLGMRTHGRDIGRMAMPIWSSPLSLHLFALHLFALHLFDLHLFEPSRVELS